MDKQLIQRLAREAGMPLVTPYQATEAESAARHNERILGIAERFAILVAEECAKIADETTEYGAPDMGCETTAGNAAEAIREAFGTQPVRPVGDLTALAEEILRAIDASEAPAFHSPPASVVPNTVPYWPRQMATRPRDPDEKG
jgi:hypothetical protein